MWAGEVFLGVFTLMHQEAVDGVKESSAAVTLARVAMRIKVLSQGAKLELEEATDTFFEAVLGFEAHRRCGKFHIGT